MMKFQVDFVAEDEARLSPCEDEKPKNAGIALFKASSDYYFLANEDAETKATIEEE